MRFEIGIIDVTQIRGCLKTDFSEDIGLDTLALKELFRQLRVKMLERDELL
jgi:hypothetical protein